MSKTLVIILGPHAVGKMTVGQELTKITDLRLFHNHMSIELARKLFAHSEKEWSVLNETIRKTVFELFAKGDFPGLIFTYMCAFDMQSEFDYLQNVIDLFKATPRNSRNRILRNGTMTKRTESPRLCSRKAHGFRPAGNACQPEPSFPARTAYSVWRSASAVLGIAFFGTGTAL